jgi:beta-N-acetylhexosaminidase
MNKKVLHNKIIIGFQSKDEKEIIELLKQYSFGGIIFFKKNIENLEHLKYMIYKIKDSFPARNLIFSIDQEMGDINRIKEGLDNIPGGREFFKIKDRKERVQLASKLAKQLEYAGINMNFAPVADISLNENDFMFNRCFGDNPKDVSVAIEDWINGFKKTKVKSVLKHFPGHGGTTVDSHKALPVKRISLKEWENHDLIPFLKGIKAGAEGIMLAHIYLPEIDKLPVPVSPFFLNYLRDKIKYKGIIISDDIEMEGFLNSGNLYENINFLVNSSINYIILGRNIKKELSEELKNILY